jgi:competence protein ComEC
MAGGVAGLRTASVAEPVLAFRYYGPVEGRIVGIDRSQSDKPRLTLDRVVLRDVSARSARLPVSASRCTATSAGSCPNRG